MARLIVAVLFFAIPLAAQQELPDAPQPKPQACSSHRLNPRIFWTGVSLLAASKTTDAIETQKLLNHGGWENTPEFGRHPSSARLAGVNAAYFAGQSALFYYTERNRRWYVRWGGRAYIGLKIASHIEYAACDSKINPRSPHLQVCHAWMPF
jgi:hypothetical protein